VNVAMNKKRIGPQKSEIGIANHDLSTAIEATRQFRDAALEHPAVAEASKFIANESSSHENTIKNKLYTATKYTLLEMRLNRETRLQEVFMSPLGVEILDPERTRSAKVQAFLNVELNRTLYVRYRDRRLPTDVELDRILTSDLGVVEKQRQHVRRTFIRSAFQAGFFEQGRERLTLPSDVSLSADLVSALNKIRADQEMEEPMTQNEGAEAGSSIVMDEALAHTTPQLPTAPLEKPTVLVLPTIADRSGETLGRPVGPNPAVIAWWWQKKPRQDAPKADWIDWQKALGIIFALEFPNEGPNDGRNA